MFLVSGEGWTCCKSRWSHLFLPGLILIALKGSGSVVTPVLKHRLCYFDVRSCYRLRNHSIYISDISRGWRSRHGRGVLRNAVQPMWKTGSVPKGDVCLLMSLLTSAYVSRTHISSLTVLALHLLRVLLGPCVSHPAK